MSEDNQYRETLAKRSSRNYPSTRNWTEDAQAKGLRGERALAEYFGAEPDLRDHPLGDGGIDLELLLYWSGEKPAWQATDAKFSSSGKHLIVEPKGTRQAAKPHIIYVLVSDEGAGDECLGWEWGRVLLSVPPTRQPKGNMAHEIERGLLHGMPELRKVYCNWWRHRGLDPRPSKFPRSPDSPFFGLCLFCGKPGLYWMPPDQWFCDDHRIV